MNSDCVALKVTRLNWESNLITFYLSCSIVFRNLQGSVQNKTEKSVAFKTGKQSRLILGRCRGLSKKL